MSRGTWHRGTVAGAAAVPRLRDAWGKQQHPRSLMADEALSGWEWECNRHRWPWNMGWSWLELVGAGWLVGWLELVGWLIEEIPLGV